MTSLLSMEYSFIIFCYILFVYGLGWALVYGSGFFNLISNFREWMSNLHPTFEELLGCMFCTPTNIGLIFSICNLLLFPQVPISPFYLIIHDISLWWLIIPMDAFFSGAISYIINTIIETLESITNKNER